MEDLYEMACDMANYPWDEPVNNMSMRNKIFYEPVVISVQNSVKKNRKRSTSMKDLLKAFKDFTYWIEFFHLVCMIRIFTN
jgi:hypothetical protein